MLFAVTCCLRNFQSIAINKIFKNFSNYTIFYFIFKTRNLKVLKSYAKYDIQGKKIKKVYKQHKAI